MQTNKSKIQTILIAVQGAFKAFKSGFTRDKTSDELFKNFTNHLDKTLGTYEILYDYILGADTANIDGKTHNYYPKLGDTIIMDISVKHDGVWCDVTRTFFVGEPTSEHINVYNMLVSAMKKGEKNIYSGALACNVYNAVNSVFKEHGENLVHHAGHKILTDALMQPQFLPENTTLLDDNSFYTLEPGLYKNFGIRIENDYLLENGTLQNLFEGLMPLDIKEYLL